LKQVFDRIAESYDRWYDTSEGQAIFNAELKCLRLLCKNLGGRWLEVGVGTGRFASMLGIATGIDPSIPMLKMAKKRGLLACAGIAEALPFPGNLFDGILLALALCFLADSAQALTECGRILRPQGSLLLGVIPAHSRWARSYERKKTEGHPVYALARFHDLPETVTGIQRTGFSLKGAACTLFWNPGEPSENEPRVATGISPEAGFVGLLFSKMA
jgi:ubiquinone/menaquinone biosynthesis C-methylase UbiE